MPRARPQRRTHNDGVFRIEIDRHDIQTKVLGVRGLAGGQQDFIGVDAHTPTIHAVRHAFVLRDAFGGDQFRLEREANAFSFEDLEQPLRQHGLCSRTDR